MQRTFASSRNIGTVGATCTALTLLTSSASAQSTYNIEELTYFADGRPECVQSELNTVTASLRQALDFDGWSGARYVDINVWEQDFWDPNRMPGGLDESYADSARVTVYAGHGSPGRVYFPGHGGAACIASTASHMRLGGAPDSAGGMSTLAIWLACEVLNVDLVGGESQIANVRQHLGWLNSIAIGDDEPRDFYEATKTQSNTDAWLALMGGTGGLDEERRPIVVTMTENEDEADCWAFHERQAWGQGVLDPLDAPAAYVCWEQLVVGEST